MNVGILGTGAIAQKHALAYQNIGFHLVACANKTEARGREFAHKWQAQFVPDYLTLCRLPELDYVDVCTFPDFHLQPLEACAAIRRPVMVQKPIAADVATAQAMVDLAAESRTILGVMSQHRFDDATEFLVQALKAARLGRILQVDAYVKWFRSDDYYSRPIKGSWKTEGGGALINQAIHQLDLLLYLFGPLHSVVATWQLGARHRIESEDVINALLTFQSGVSGVLQASTALWPGYPERIEIHGTKGSAILTGDQLTTWDVLDDEHWAQTHPAPVTTALASGSSDPMAISVVSFERQFLDFAQAIKDDRAPLVDGRAGLQALQAVQSIYQSCREGRFVQLMS